MIGDAARGRRRLRSARRARRDAARARPAAARGRARARRGDAVRAPAAAAHDRARGRARRRATPSSCWRCSPPPPGARASSPTRSSRPRARRSTRSTRATARSCAAPPCSASCSARRALRHVLDPAARAPDGDDLGAAVDDPRARGRRLRALREPDPLRGRLRRPPVRPAPRAARGRRRGARARPRHRRRRRPGRALRALQPRRRPRPRLALRAAGRRARDARASPSPTRSRLYRRRSTPIAAPSATAEELAAVWEALGEALMLRRRDAGRRARAGSARRLLAGEPIAEARICFRRGQIAERSELSSAVRWMRAGCACSSGAPEPRGAGLARAADRRAGLDPPAPAPLPRGRAALPRGARESARRPASCARRRAASYTLDWALFELGRFDEATHSARALEIYRELGDPEQEGRVLNNLGGLAYWRGRWQEAIDLYEQAGACSERAGHAADLAFTDGNIGEILADQGHLDDAARHLRRAQRVWSVDRRPPGIGVREHAARARRGARRAHRRGARAAARRRSPTCGASTSTSTPTSRSALIAEGEALGGDPERARDARRRSSSPPARATCRCCGACAGSRSHASASADGRAGGAATGARGRPRARRGLRRRARARRARDDRAAPRRTSCSRARRDLRAARRGRRAASRAPRRRPCRSPRRRSGRAARRPSSSAGPRLRPGCSRRATML